MINEQKTTEQKRAELANRIAEIYAVGGYVAVVIVQRGTVKPAVETLQIGRRWPMSEAIELLPLDALD